MRKVVYELRSEPNRIVFESVYILNVPYRHRYEVTNIVAQAIRLEPVYNVRDYSLGELKDALC